MEGKFEYSRMALVPSIKAGTDKLREPGIMARWFSPLMKLSALLTFP
jgi:hypothetical protein